MIVLTTSVATELVWMKSTRTGSYLQLNTHPRSFRVGIKQLNLIRLHLSSSRCECRQGFEGEFCELEINECERYAPCAHGACVDLVGDYRLVNKAGCHRRHQLED